MMAHQIFCKGGSARDEKMEPTGSKVLQTRGQKDLRTVKKGVNKIENWYKMLQNGQMTDFCEKLDQLKFKLSLELNVIETNRFFCRKRGSI